jgi:hypothetical protein
MGVRNAQIYLLLNWLNVLPLLYYKTDSTYYNQILYTELDFDLSLTEKT